ncbi:MAG: hypothetical protein JST25_14545 [Actinobacteria bacterium]|nr:hypothetical protein [Actinomycetota bacterium]
MTDPQQPRPVPPPAGYPAPPVPPAPYPQPPFGQPPYPQQPSAQPVPQAPPGAFAGPAGGYAAPYPAAAPAAGGAALGRIALILALLATVVLTVVGTVLAAQIGHGAGSGVSITDLERQFAAEDLSAFTPVRQIVLWWEITAWAASALGIWALVQGIVAIARRRGRGSGIAAVIIAALGPFVFFLAAYLALVVSLGLATVTG